MIRIERYPLRRLFRRAPYATGYVVHCFGMSWLRRGLAQSAKMNYAAPTYQRINQRGWQHGDVDGGNAGG